MRDSRNNVIDFLERHCRRIPERTALVWSPPGDDDGTPARMTYVGLAARSEAAASGLAERGVRVGDRVIVLVPMSAELYVVMFALQRLGAIPVFLDSWARRDELGEVARRVAPRGLVAPAALLRLVEGRPLLDRVAVRVATGEGESPRGAVALAELLATPGSCPPAPVHGDDTALVTFTTGSTGAPKGADRSHRFLVEQHEALRRCIPYRPDDVDLPVFPIFSLNNLASGIGTVLPAPDLARPAPEDGARLLAQMRRTGATTCTLSPSLLRAVIRAAQEEGAGAPALRRCVTGGAPVSAVDRAGFRAVAPRAEVHVLYGSTEAEPIAHLRPQDAGDGGALSGATADGVDAGLLVPGLRARVIRPVPGPIVLGPRGWAAWEVAPGEPGELVIAGAHVCDRYFRDPDAVRRAKIADPDGTVWHRTGDVCSVTNRRVRILGRVHNAIRREGRVLLPVGAEAAMRGLPWVEAAAYVGLPDAELGERACAAFTVRAGQGGPDAAAAVRSVLEARGIPVDEVRLLGEMPLDARHHSKPEYAEIRRRILGAAP